MNRDEFKSRLKRLKLVSGVFWFLYAVLVISLSNCAIAFGLFHWESFLISAVGVLVYVLVLSMPFFVPKLVTQLFRLICPVCHKEIASDRALETGKCRFCGSKIFDEEGTH